MNYVYLYLYLLNRSFSCKKNLTEVIETFENDKNNISILRNCSAVSIEATTTSLSSDQQTVEEGKSKLFITDPFTKLLCKMNEI